MHMADALVSPAVGASFWAVSAGLIGYASKKIKDAPDDRIIPLMGVMAAFIFAAQMINFSIPMTGSSGHFGGGMILAVVLGPNAAFLAMVSVLTVQALFFADGGLLALGCNIFNLGLLPCYVVYPLIWYGLIGKKPTPNKIVVGSIVGSAVSLQLGAFGVVLETAASGVSELPVRTFLFLMQSIHLVIGIVEGLVTAAVVVFVWKARPGILDGNAALARGNGACKLLACIGITALAAGVVLGGLASKKPDGLEWAISKASHE